MSSQYVVALVGDYKPSVPAHQAIPISLSLAAAHHGVEVESRWIPTTGIRRADVEFARFAGIWCVPASPYDNIAGALDAIRFARERQIPFLGTCGGFQHALIEYARNVLQMTSTEHAELSPQASDPLISALACSLLDTEADVVLEPGSLLHRCYRTTRIRAEYRCNYGPNPARETSLFAGDFRVTARDSKGEVRGAELQGHPFFVGTLFQPERSALRGELPPVVREFVAAISKGDSCTES